LKEEVYRLDAALERVGRDTETRFHHLEQAIEQCRVDIPPVRGLAERNRGKIDDLEAHFGRTETRVDECVRLQGGLSYASLFDEINVLRFKAVEHEESIATKAPLVEMHALMAMVKVIEDVLPTKAEHILLDVERDRITATNEKIKELYGLAASQDKMSQTLEGMIRRLPPRIEKLEEFPPQVEVLHKQVTMLQTGAAVEEQRNSVRADATSQEMKMLGDSVVTLGEAVKRDLLKVERLAHLFGMPSCVQAQHWRSAPMTQRGGQSNKSRPTSRSGQLAPIENNSTSPTSP